MEPSAQSTAGEAGRAAGAGGVANARSASALHSWLGVGPLLAYACFHAWQQWPALQDREAWLERSRATSLGLIGGAIVLGTFATHALRGVGKLLVRAPGAGTAPARDSLSNFQLFSGVLLGLFTLFHLAQLWPLSSGPEAGAFDSYEVLWSTLGLPQVLVVYVLGVSALAFHLATGLARFAERALPRVSRRGLRYACGAAGVLLWLVYLQLVGRFALGEGVVPTAQPGAEAAPPSL